ncbi:U3 small nucleolar RNA-associated protein 9 [Metschnikowia aff. pulcherrima]|uniref:U3 small nucleolar RNA-associated protein 9 n=1 Tax=Metschnikowia aff. pulcherrima TaxID=2163413 RepID=A0A4P6XNX2_9ASCO|nr:U3 small nucleolar RNA-associated protein 9 [Metschnikowia aff. pulcherrima]
MSEPYSVVDALGQYLASIIPRQGRNEVQFYPLTSQKTLVDTAKISRHELQADLDIAAVTWLNEQATSASSSEISTKKRPAMALSSLENGSAHESSPKQSKNGDFAPENGHSAPKVSLLLAVALKLGEIWTFSPTNDQRVAQFEAPEAISAITPSTHANHFWALGKLKSIYEINAVDGEVTKTIRFGRIDLSTSAIAQCHFSVKKKRLGPVTEPLFVGSSHLFLIDAAKQRGYTVNEFVDESEEKSLVLQIHTVSSDGLRVVMVRGNSRVLALYDIADPSLIPLYLNCQDSDIRSVRALADAYVVVHTAKGAELFALDGVESTPVATITPQPKNVVFENFYYSQAHGVVAIYYDGNQPQFVPIQREPKFEGAHVIPIEMTESADAPEPVRDLDIAFTAEQNDEIVNVPAGKLSAELSALLLQEPVSSDEVIALCAANDDEANIRDAVRLFAQLDEYSTLVEQLFAVVSKRVCADPTRRSSLSVWLRWVLLAHGGHIAKQKKFADSLRLLQRSLDDGMLLMGKLLALQGRLQLLKSQAELRTRVNDESGSDHEQTELDQLNDTFNTTNIEESVVYANGENDDFEDAPEEFANGPERAELVYENGEEDMDESEAETEKEVVSGDEQK